MEDSELEKKVFLQELNVSISGADPTSSDMLCAGIYCFQEQPKLVELLYNYCNFIKDKRMIMDKAVTKHLPTYSHLKVPDIVKRELIMCQLVLPVQSCTEFFNSWFPNRCQSDSYTVALLLSWKNYLRPSGNGKTFRKPYTFAVKDRVLIEMKEEFVSLEGFI